MSCGTCGSRCSVCERRTQLNRAFMFCQCGCGESLRGMNAQAKYISAAHRKRADRAAGKYSPAERRRCSPMRHPCEDSL
jgi:hypothetical protein